MLLDDQQQFERVCVKRVPMLHFSFQYLDCHTDWLKFEGSCWGKVISYFGKICAYVERRDIIGSKVSKIIYDPCANRGSKNKSFNLEES